MWCPALLALPSVFSNRLRVPTRLAAHLAASLFSLFKTFVVAAGGTPIERRGCRVSSSYTVPLVPNKIGQPGCRRIFLPESAQGQHVVGGLSSFALLVLHLGSI